MGQQVKKPWKQIVGAHNLTSSIVNEMSQHKAELERINRTDKAVTPAELAENKRVLAKYSKEIPILTQILTHFQNQVAEYSSLREDVQIDFAMTQDGTPNGALLRSEKDGSLLFNPEGEKKARKAIRELNDQEVFIPVLELPLTSKLEYSYLNEFVVYKKK